MVGCLWGPPVGKLTWRILRWATSPRSVSTVPVDGPFDAVVSGRVRSFDDVGTPCGEGGGEGDDEDEADEEEEDDDDEDEDDEDDEADDEEC